MYVRYTIKNYIIAYLKFDLKGTEIASNISNIISCLYI